MHQRRPCLLTIGNNNNSCLIVLVRPILILRIWNNLFSFRVQKLIDPNFENSWFVSFFFCNFRHSNMWQKWQFQPLVLSSPKNLIRTDVIWSKFNIFCQYMNVNEWMYKSDSLYISSHVIILLKNNISFACFKCKLFAIDDINLMMGK